MCDWPALEGENGGEGRHTPTPGAVALGKGTRDNVGEVCTGWAERAGEDKGDDCRRDGLGEG